MNKLQGELALADKNYAQAIDNFSDLYEKRPTALNAMQLARSLKFNGEDAQAAKTLETYLIDQEKAHKVRILLAELYLQLSDNDKAIEHFKILNNAKKDNVYVLNNLAWLLMEQSSGEIALPFVRKAYELKPDAHQILDTYGAVLVSVKDFDNAVSILQSAIENGSKAGSTYVNLAKAYLATGKKNKINELLNQIDDKAISLKVKALM